MKQYIEDIKNIHGAATKAVAERIGLIQEMGEDSAIGAGSAAEEEANKIADIVADLYTGIKEASDRYHKDMLDAERDYWRDIEQLGIDAQRDIEESWIDHYANAYEIARRMNDD